MQVSRFSDLPVLTPGIDPNTQLPSSEGVLGTFTPTTIFVITPLIQSPGRIKTLFVKLSAALTFAVAQQPSVALVVSRKPLATFTTGATDPTIPGGALNTGLDTDVDAVAPNTNLVAAASASIPPQTIAFGPSATGGNLMNSLADYYPCVGLRFSFVAAPTGGTLSAYFEWAPI